MTMKETMREIALVSANFAGLDDFKALPTHEGIDAFYYTDALTRGGAAQGAIASWSQVVVPGYPRHDFGPMLRSRYFKQQIHRLDEVRGHRWLVWADASLQLHDTRFILDEVAVLERLAPRQRILLVPHPQRKTVRQEYEYVRDAIQQGNDYFIARYAREKMPEQMAHYLDRGWDVDAPRLWCGGFWIVENSGFLNRCWDDWWHQTVRFGSMDQLSLPVVLADHGCDPRRFDVSIWKNPYFTHVQHAREM